MERDIKFFLTLKNENGFLPLVLNSHYLRKFLESIVVELFLVIVKICCKCSHPIVLNASLAV